MTILPAPGDDVPTGTGRASRRPDRDSPRHRGARRRVKRNRIAILVAVSVVVLALGLVLGLRAPARFLDSPEPPRELEVLGGVLVVAGLMTCIVGAVRARRTGALRLVWNSPAALLGRPDRKRLLERIRADAGVPPADEEAAVALAEQVVSQGALVPPHLGLAVYFVGNSLLVSSPLGRWFLAVALVLFAVALPLLVRDSRRAHVWLGHHRPGER